jgi:hypothetical protein
VFESTVSKDFNLKNISTHTNPLLYEDSGKLDFILLLEEPKPVFIEPFKTMLKNLTGRKVNIRVLSVLPFIPKDKDRDKNVIEFFDKNSIDLKKYITPNSKILCEGRAIHTIAYGDLGVYDFYDFIRY